jgi:hypothetical protein
MHSLEINHNLLDCYGIKLILFSFMSVQFLTVREFSGNEYYVLYVRIFSSCAEYCVQHKMRLKRMQ